MKAANIYLLLGPEKVLKRERIAAILRQHGISDDPASPERMQYFASESASEDIMGEIATYPFFGEKKAVIVHEVEHLDRRALEEYCASPLATTVLILLSDKNKGKFNASLERICEQMGSVEMFWELFEDKLSSWAERKARHEYGMQSPPGLGSLLTELCGRNMSFAEQSLQILANRFMQNPFTLDEARKTIGEQKGSTVFDCVAYCFGGELIPALASLRNFLAEGESPILLQTMLMRQAELLWRYQAGARSMGALGVQPMAFREIEKQSRFWPQPLLARALRFIHSLDRSLKSEASYVSALRLELAILALARRKF